MASGLSIVIDTRNAELNIKNLNQALERLENQGNSIANMMRNLGSNNPFAALTASINVTKSDFNALAASANLVKSNVKEMGDSLVYAKSTLTGAATAATTFQAAMRGVGNSLNTAQAAMARFNQSGQSIANVLNTMNGASGSNGVNNLNNAIKQLNPNIAALNNETKAVTASLRAFSTAAIAAEAATLKLDVALLAARANMATLSTTTVAADAALLGLQGVFSRLQTQAAALGTSIATLNRNISSIPQVNNAAARSANTAAQSTALFQRSAQGLGSTLMRLQTLMTGGLFGMVALSIAKTADTMQGLESQVRLVTQGEEQREEVQRRLLVIANKNFADIEATTGSYQRNAFALAQLGKSQMDVLNFTDALSLAMRTGGRSMVEQKSAVYQLSQAMGAGKLMGDEFRALSENAPIILKYIAKEMGVAQGALKELGSEGKITSEIIYNAMMKARPEMEKMAQSLPITMSQAWQQVNNSYKTFVDNFMNGTGGMSQGIASMLQGIGKNFDALANIAIAGAGVAMLGLANKVLFAGGAFAKLTTIMKANPLFLIASVVIGASIATRGFDETIQDLSNTVSVLGSVLGDVIGFFGDLANTAYTAFSGILTNANETADGSNQAFGGFFADTGTGFQGFLVGTVKVFDAIAVTVRSTAQYCGERFGKMVIDVSNFFITLSNNVKTAFAGVVNYVVDYINQSISAINGLIEQANSKTVFGYGLNIGTMGMVGRYTPNLGQTKSSLPVSYQDIYDGNAKSQQTSGLQQYFQGKFDAQAKSTKALTGATGDLNKMIDANAYAMHNAQKAIEAKATADKAAAKAAKEHDKAQRELLNGARLVGVSGNSGIGTGAHLDIRASGGGRRLTDAELARFQAGGKQLSAYRKTSEYGSRKAPTTGASKFHRGIDFAMPVGTPITTKVAIKDIKSFYDSKGGGYVQRILFADGLSVDLLHQSPKAQGIKGGASTGIGKLDSMMSKLDSTYEKQAEKAAREQEQNLAKAVELRKEYGTKAQQIEADLAKKLEDIRNNSALSASEKDKFSTQAKVDAENELAIYRNTINQKISALLDFRKTQQQILDDKYAQDVFDAKHSKDLQGQDLTNYLDNLKTKYDFDTAANTANLQKQRSELDAYLKDERQLLADNWDSQIDEARLKFYELSDIRIETLKAQKDRALEIFDLEQSQKLLDLQKFNIADIAYFEQTLKIKNDLVDKSNATQAMKDAQKAANEYETYNSVYDTRKSANDGYMSTYFDLYGQKDKYEAYKGVEDKRIAQNDAVQKALDAGIIQHEEYYQTLKDIDAQYVASKQAILVGGYQSIFGSMTSLMSAFGGGQSRAYRIMANIEKGYALYSALLSEKVALGKAWASAPFPQNLVAVAKVALESSSIIGAINSFAPKGFSTGGYTGNMGVNDVAGVVHGKEYVLNAAATKRIGVDNLNAMNKGASIGNNNVSVNVVVNADGSSDVQANAQMGKQMGDAIKATVLQTIVQEKRQGGLLAR